MLNGWGGYVLTHADYVNAFFSHDEYIDFFCQARCWSDRGTRGTLEHKQDSWSRLDSYLATVTGVKS